jgi:hypothetical protein
MVLANDAGNDGSIGVPLVGSYTDEIVKIGGRWYFQNRFDRLDLSAAQ